MSPKIGNPGNLGADVRIYAISVSRATLEIYVILAIDLDSNYYDILSPYYAEHTIFD